MRILALDMGTGTQDILLFDSSLEIENCPKLVVPSATAMVAQRIRQATARRQSLLLTGVTMGGGPSYWAVNAHIKAGLAVFATPDAARSFNDELPIVERWGIKVLSEDEAKAWSDGEHVELKDLDVAAIMGALATFGVEPHLDGLAVAVLDHGEAPPGVSDRKFRFDYLQRTVDAQNDLFTFAYLASEVPSYLTRMRAVASTAPGDLPLLLLDTGPAAALGALDDPQVASQPNRLILNLGNMHTLCFHLEGTSIRGLFEHHTHLMTAPKLDSMVERLRQGSLTNQEIFDGEGHGCYILESRPQTDFLAVTGPRRSLMASSSLSPYLAAPHGDMMLTGCFGLLRSFAHKMPSWREEIIKTLDRG